MKLFHLLGSLCLAAVALISCVDANAVTTSPRLDCHLDYDDIDAAKCASRGCIWDEVVPRHAEIPSCFLNLTQVGYKLSDASKANAGKQLPLALGSSAELSLDLLDSAKASAPKFTLLKNLKIKFTPVTSSILRFQVVDPQNSNRYQVPTQSTFPLLAEKPKNESLGYSVQIGQDLGLFGFKVTRNDNHEFVWDSTFGGGLLYSDQFIQLATRLPTEFVYGMGENTHTSYLHSLDYKTWPLFAFDQPPDDLERNSYGVHPIMMLLDAKHGSANAIFFLNSNAMEYTLTPDPMIAYKTSGGILDFFLFMGKNPEDIVQQYLSLIGRPMMPPFWGLGFQLSRYGYKDTAQVKRVIERNRKANIPMDVHYVDIDYMNEFDDFTYDHQNFSGLPALVEQTRKDMDLRWTFIIDVAIQGNNPKYQPFLDAYKKDVFVRWDKSIANNTRGNPSDAPLDRNVFYGRVWPRGPSAFPDFFKKAAAEWWEENLKAFYKELSYDGIWIDMNEPANFDNRYEVCPTKDCYMSVCPKNPLDFPVARLKAVWVHNRTENRLSYRTLCLATRQGEKDEFLHYDVHSLYALTEAVATNQALARIRNRRSLILSRSSFVSSGRYTAHWTGDNTSKWSHLRRSVLQLLEFNLFGIPWVGADICGFQNDTTPELCLRWLQLGALYPFARSHNDIKNSKGVTTIDQDPAVWIEYNHPEVTKAGLESLNYRYSHLLHYMYTLFFHAHTTGTTVIRPLLHEFPKDHRTYKVDEQFMVGRAILVAPFLYEGQTKLTAYLPNETWWFDIGGETEGNQGYVLVEDTKTVAPVYYRADSILPVAITNAAPILNTKQLRQRPLRLDIYPSEDQSTASGDLFWDDGEALNSIDAKQYNYYSFEMSHHSGINITAVHSGYKAESIIVEEIRIHGPFKRVVGPGIGYVLKWTEGTTPKKATAVQSENYVTFSGLHFNLTSLETGGTIQLTYSIVPQ